MTTEKFEHAEDRRLVPEEFIRCPGRVVSACAVLMLGAELLFCPSARSEKVADVADNSGESVLPAAIHCGEVREAVRSLSPVSWVELDAMLTKGELEIGSVSESVATGERPPGEDKAYVILDVEVAEDRSIGRADYVLIAEGRQFPCLAISSDDAPFDQRNWEILGPEASIRMLFEIPEETPAVSFAFDLSSTVPLRSVSGIRLLPGEESAEADAYSGETETADAELPAPSQEDRPAPEPDEPALAEKSARPGKKQQEADRSGKGSGKESQQSGTSRSGKREKRNAKKQTGGDRGKKEPSDSADSQDGSDWF